MVRTAERTFRGTHDGSARGDPACRRYPRAGAGCGMGARGTRDPRLLEGVTMIGSGGEACASVFHAESAESAEKSTTVAVLRALRALRVRPLKQTVPERATLSHDVSGTPD